MHAKLPCGWTIMKYWKDHSNLSDLLKASLLNLKIIVQPLVKEFNSEIARTKYIEGNLSFTWNQFQNRYQSSSLNHSHLHGLIEFLILEGIIITRTTQRTQRFGRESCKWKPTMGMSIAILLDQACKLKEKKLHGTEHLWSDSWTHKKWKTSIFSRFYGHWLNQSHPHKGRKGSHRLHGQNFFSLNTIGKEDGWKNKLWKIHQFTLKFRKFLHILLQSTFHEYMCPLWQVFTSNTVKVNRYCTSEKRMKGETRRVIRSPMLILINGWMSIHTKTC